MISFDTNILLYSLNPSFSEHGAANRFLGSVRHRMDVVLCQLVLVELYPLLRNEVLFPGALGPAEAVRVIEQIEAAPTWQIVDYPGGLMNQVWRDAARPGFPRRAIFDARLARTLIHHGVTEFATRNTKDFERFGFKRVFNPID